MSFASKFSGFIDSTVLLMEKDRVLKEKLFHRGFIKKRQTSILIKEEASYTLINPYTEQEQQALRSLRCIMLLLKV